MYRRNIPTSGQQWTTVDNFKIHVVHCKVIDFKEVVDKVQDLVIYIILFLRFRKTNTQPAKVDRNVVPCPPRTCIDTTTLLH